MSADARCPEPKPVTILLLAAAGAAGFVVKEAVLHLVLWGKVSPTYFNLRWDILFGLGLGASIGTAISISRRAWIAFVVCSVLAFGSWFITDCGSVPSSEYAIRSPIVCLALVTNVIPAVTLALLHCAFLGWQKKRELIPLALPFYLCLGALSFSFEASPLRIESEWTTQILFTPRLLPGGAIFALIQFLAMLLALAVDRRQQHEGGAS